MIQHLETIPKVLPNSIPVPAVVVVGASYIWYYVSEVLNKIPGTGYIASYIRKSHQDDPYRTIVEILLIVYGIIYFLNKPRKKGQVTLTPELSEQEMQNLIYEWEPEEIVITDERNDWRLSKIPVIMGSGINNYVDISRDNEEEVYHNVFNASSNNFLQLSSDIKVIDEVNKTIKNYGVGACGPAGFYGNQDVHYNLEYDMARFFGTENAVLYGQDFCVSSSVIPAFTKRGDIIVADNQINISLQNALQLSRSTVYHYKHNDMESLKKLLHELNENEKSENLPIIPRKFIVTEGIFQNTGDIAPLPELVKLKNKYKYRLFIDETLSLGTLGSTGRGLTEYFNMERASSVDITVGSLGVALGSSGGVVLGDNVMSHHQRIGSNAYCFSASLPPYTARTVSKVLEIMDSDNTAITHLQNLARKMHNFFKQDHQLSKYVKIPSDDLSSVLHIQLTDTFREIKFHSTIQQIYNDLSQQQARCMSNKFVESFENEDKFLQEIVDTALITGNVLITRNIIALKHETLPITPGLKICCNAKMSEQELIDACNVVKNAILICCE